MPENRIAIEIRIVPDDLGARRHLAAAFGRAVQERASQLYPEATVVCRPGLFAGTTVSGMPEEEQDGIEAIRERISALIVEVFGEPESWAGQETAPHLPDPGGAGQEEALHTPEAPSARTPQATPEPALAPEPEPAREEEAAAEKDSAGIAPPEDLLAGALLFRRKDNFLAYLSARGVGVRLSAGEAGACAVLTTFPGLPFDRAAFRRRYGDPGKAISLQDVPDETAARLRAILLQELDPKKPALRGMIPHSSRK